MEMMRVRAVRMQGLTRDPRAEPRPTRRSSSGCKSWLMRTKSSSRIHGPTHSTGIRGRARWTSRTTLATLDYLTTPYAVDVCCLTASYLEATDELNIAWVSKTSIACAWDSTRDISNDATISFLLAIHLRLSSIHQDPYKSMSLNMTLFSNLSISPIG